MLLSDAQEVRVGTALAKGIYVGATKVWPVAVGPVSLMRFVADTVVLDAAVGQSSFARTVTDAVTISGSATGAVGGRARTAADTVAMGGSASRASASRLRTAADSWTRSDTAQRAPSVRGRSVSDAVTISDSVGRAPASRVRTVGDSVIVSDLAAGVVTPVPSGEFSPSDLSGLAIWLDAMQVEDVEGQVENWPNSGSASDPTIVGSPFPVMRTNALSGRPVVRFKASEGRVRMTGTGVNTDWTLVYVGRLNGLGPVGRVVNATYPPNNLLVGFWNAQQDVLYDNGFASNTYQPWTSDWKLYSGDGADSPRESRLFSDGTLLGSTTTSQGWGGTFNISGYAPGADASETCDCEVAEVCLYNRKLSDTERQQVETYLREKWIAPPLPVPKQVSGLGVWLDASQLALADGASVSTWNDSSGGGHHATSMDVAPKYRATGFNGLPTVEFTGPSPATRLRIPGWGTMLSGKTQYTLFYVLQNQGGLGNYPVLNVAPVDALWQWITEFGPGGTFYWGHQNGQYRYYSAGFGETQKLLLSLHHTPGGAHLYSDGAEVTSYSVPTGSDIPQTVTNVDGDVVLGGYQTGQPLGMNANICEVIWYDHALTDPQRVLIEDYLRGKWSIAPGGLMAPEQQPVLPEIPPPPWGDAA